MRREGKPYEACVALGKCEPDADKNILSECHKKLKFDADCYNKQDCSAKEACSQACYICTRLLRDAPLFQETCTPQGVNLSDEVERPPPAEVPENVPAPNSTLFLQSFSLPMTCVPLCFLLACFRFCVCIRSHSVSSWPTSTSLVPRFAEEHLEQEQEQEAEQEHEAEAEQGSEAEAAAVAEQGLLTSQEWESLADYRARIASEKKAAEVRKVAQVAKEHAARNSAFAEYQNLDAKHDETIEQLEEEKRKIRRQDKKLTSGSAHAPTPIKVNLPQFTVPPNGGATDDKYTMFLEEQVRLHVRSLHQMHQKQKSGSRSRSRAASRRNSQRDDGDGAAAPGGGGGAAPAAVAAPSPAVIADACLQTWNKFKNSRRARYFMSYKEVTQIEPDPTDMKQGLLWDANAVCKCLGECEMQPGESLEYLKPCTYNKLHDMVMRMAFPKVAEP